MIFGERRLKGLTIEKLFVGTKADPTIFSTPRFSERLLNSIILISQIDVRAWRGRPSRRSNWINQFGAGQRSLIEFQIGSRFLFVGRVQGTVEVKKKIRNKKSIDKSCFSGVSRLTRNCSTHFHAKTAHGKYEVFHMAWNAPRRNESIPNAGKLSPDF